MVNPHRWRRWHRLIGFLAAFSLCWLTGCDALIPLVGIKGGIDHPTLERIDKLNTTVRAINETIDSGVELGPETRALVDRLNQTVRHLNETGVGLDPQTLAVAESLAKQIQRGLEVGPETLARVDSLLNSLNSAPERWEDTGTQLIQTLEASSSDIARQLADEASTLITQAHTDSESLVTTIGAEARCNIDFGLTRANESLDTTIGRGLGQNLVYLFFGAPDAAPAPRRLAQVCQVLPQTLQLVQIGDQVLAQDPPVIAISGYNFSGDQLPEVTIVDEAGTASTQFMIEPLRLSPYSIQLNLQGLDFSALPVRSKLMLTWPEMGSLVIPILLPTEPTPTPTLTTRPIPALTTLIATAARQGPANAFPVVAEVAAGQTFVVTAKDSSGTWWEVDLNGTRAWIYGAHSQVTNGELVETSYDVPPTPTHTPTPCPAPEIRTFTATPATIEIGGEVTLAWDVGGEADAFFIDNGIGPVGRSGTRVVAPQATTTYRLTVRGCGGEQSAEVAVGATAPPNPVLVIAAHLHIKDDDSGDIFGSDDHGDWDRNLQLPVSLEEPGLAELKECVDDEVRGEVYFRATLEPDRRSVLLTVTVLLFESDTCNTDDLHWREEQVFRITSGELIAKTVRAPDNDGNVVEVRFEASNQRP